jgi:hypothetical protein
MNIVLSLSYQSAYRGRHVEEGQEHSVDGIGPYLNVDLTNNTPVFAKPQIVGQSRSA